MKTEKEMIELLKKINILRKDVKDTLVKSGKNDYAHFTYFQLKDFLPTIIDSCASKQDLYIEFNIDKEKVDLPKKVTTTIGESANTTITEENFEYREYAYLTVIDLASGISRVYKKEAKDATVSGATAIQNLGAKSTYMKRYLYMDFLELSEDDQVDGSDNSKDVKVTIEPKKVETKKETPKKAEKVVDTSSNDLLSLADKAEITKLITENGLEASIILEISKDLGYNSPVELRVKDKEAVLAAIKEKVGK